MRGSKMDAMKMQKNRGNCSAPGCRSVWTVGGKHFFTFPEETVRCWKWLRFCGLEDQYRVASDVTRSLKICIDHFTKSDYYMYPQKVRLNNTAVPTVHADVIDVPSNTKIRSPPPSPTMPGSPPIFRHHNTLRTYARKPKIASAAAEGRLPSLIGLLATNEQDPGLAATNQTILSPMISPAAKITASTTYAGMNKDTSVISEQLRGHQKSSLLFDVVPTAEFVMDVIKAEPEVDPLAVQSCDDAIQEEAYSSPDEELCDLDTVKDELKLEVTEDENENLANSFADTRTMSFDCGDFAQGEHRTSFEISKISVSSANISQPNRSMGIFKCDVCEESFWWKPSFARHQRRHTGPQPFICEFCGKCFSKRCNLDAHIRTHTGEKPFRCDVCGKCFSQGKILKRHELKHSDEKPFQCIFCGKCFTWRGTLIVHERQHTGEKRFQCNVCGKCFSRSDYLGIHQRNHMGEKPYTCNVCGKCFSQRSNLKLHQYKHSSEKSLSCDVCQKSFYFMGSLKSHRRQHTGEEPYRCNVCPKRFCHLSSMKIHERLHTGEKPYTCNVCDKSFAQSCHLKRHQRQHYDEKPFK